MKKLLLEFTKVTFLSFCIVIGVIIFEAEPAEAKTRRIQESRNNLVKELTREEKNERMQYLRTLSGYEYQDPIYKQAIE